MIRMGKVIIDGFRNTYSMHFVASGLRRLEQTMYCCCRAIASDIKEIANMIVLKTCYGSLQVIIGQRIMRRTESRRRRMKEAWPEVNRLLAKINEIVL